MRLLTFLVAVRHCLTSRPPTLLVFWSFFLQVSFFYFMFVVGYLFVFSLSYMYSSFQIIFSGLVFHPAMNVTFQNLFLH